MRTRWITAALSALALLMLAATAAAEDIYRWVDENGTVHFGSLPPEGVDATLVSTAPAAARAASDAPTTDEAFAEPEGKSPGQLAREEREQRRQEQALKQSQVEAQCAAMRRQLEQLEPHTRVIVQDEDGEVRRLEDTERLKLVEEAKAFIAENDCE